MNKQWKSPTRRGIEWCTHTWNVVQGCRHDCKWTMPDGSIAECYAKTVAEKFRSDKFMPHGFEHHTFQADRLQEPLKLKTPAKVFLDSFSDLMGHWVPDEEIEAVLDIARQAHWHTFQLLTKNYRRLTDFAFPDNVWVGVSAPPTQMNGRSLSEAQQHRMVTLTLDTLAQVRAKIKWMSIEPLSFDIAQDFLDWRECDGIPTRLPLQWAVIGAATNGPKVYQPEPEWVNNALEVLRWDDVPVFFKGNLKGCPATIPWREEFPA